MMRLGPLFAILAFAVIASVLLIIYVASGTLAAGLSGETRGEIVKLLVQAIVAIFIGAAVSFVFDTAKQDRENSFKLEEEKRSNLVKDAERAREESSIRPEIRNCEFMAGFRASAH